MTVSYYKNIGLYRVGFRFFKSFLGAKTHIDNEKKYNINSIDIIFYILMMCLCAGIARYIIAALTGDLF